jgi:PPK2 family polyphosphate:nucleotide phosphotransferase
VADDPKDDSKDASTWSDKELLKKARKLERDYRITGGRFRLKDHDPDDTNGFEDEDKERSKEVLQAGVRVLADLQDRLAAQDKWGVLLIFQAMDAAGKDGAIKHVMSGINPQGCQVTSFKSPSSEELDHDFLWRCTRWLPARGMIGIFNRSYYEETLVVRVHPEILRHQKLPEECITKHVWEERYQAIRGLERYLTRNGFVVLKFFLNVSRKEQKKRFLERIHNPEKNWKFSISDAKERGHWDEYMRAYEETIRETATENAPWYVVPANNKWYTRIVVASAIVTALDKLDLKYPVVNAARRRELLAAGRALTRER